MKHRLAGWICAASHTLSVMASPAPGVSFFTPPNVAAGTTTYAWDFMNRLVGVAMPGGRSFGYQYDYRSRRLGISDTKASGTTHTAVVFSEGLSVAEYESSTAITTTAGLTPEVQYIRGTDMGGGMGSGEWGQGATA